LSPLSSLYAARLLRFCLYCPLKTLEHWLFRHFFPIRSSFPVFSFFPLTRLFPRVPFFFLARPLSRGAGSHACVYACLYLGFFR
jgi:hypothetical protein